MLLTTPESIEAMLLSRRVDAGTILRALREVVVDEIHAFAGDDRGWHLVALLAMVEALVPEPMQRIGLTATLGNPAELLDWLVLVSSTACAARTPGRPSCVSQQLTFRRRGSDTRTKRDLAMSDVEALRAEYKALLESWEYAFAMGHGCSVGDHPVFRAVRQRAEDLRARIAEHTP